MDALEELNFTLDEASPTDCISALRDPQHVGVVRNRLRQADVDEQWMTAFVEEGGLSAIWSVFEASAKYCPPRISALFECIQCIQAIVAMPHSADFLVRSSEGFVGKLILGTLVHHVRTLFFIVLFSSIRRLCFLQQHGVYTFKFVN